MCRRPSTPSQLLATFRARFAALCATLRRRFPTVCEGRIEDAVSEAVLIVYADPVLCGLLLTGPERQARSLLIRVAWRHLRGQCRRRAYRGEQGGAALEGLPVASPAPTSDAQLMALDLDDRVRELAVRAAVEVNRRQRDTLEAALLDRLYGELTDAEAGARHAIPREYVNRARRALAGWLR